VAGTGAARTYTVDPDGAGAAAPFTIAHPDFNFRSLRGNAVFRWEYLPGPTLYVTWTHSRAEKTTVGDVDFARDRAAIVQARPDNVLLIKAIR
jgi:hypothetical protein